MPNRNDQNSIHMISSFEDLIAGLRQCNQRIDVLHQYSSDDFKAVNNRIRSFHQQATVVLKHLSVTGNKLHADKEKKALMSHAEQASSSISQIVTRLQFHDIIRQKLEHVQDTNGCIIEELLQNISGHVSHQQNQYLPVIREIIRLHVAQLTDTDITYQQVFAEIKVFLQSIREVNAIIAQDSYMSTPEHSGAGSGFSSVSVASLSKNISLQAADTLGNIKQNEKFNLLVKETSSSLDALQVKIPSAIIESAATGKHTDTLQSLKHLYTMESERIIFDQVLNGQKMPGTYTNQQKDTSENIELF